MRVDDGVMTCDFHAWRELAQSPGLKSPVSICYTGRMHLQSSKTVEEVGLHGGHTAQQYRTLRSVIGGPNLHSMAKS